LCCAWRITGYQGKVVVFWWEFYGVGFIVPFNISIGHHLINIFPLGEIVIYHHFIFWLELVDIFKWG